MLSMNLRVALAAVVTAVAGCACRTAMAQTTCPGAMKSDGSFFVLKGSAPPLQVWERTPSGWVQHGTLNSTVMPTEDEAPAGVTPTGGFHVAGKRPGDAYGVARWEPASGGVTFDFPFPFSAKISRPSELMYGNRLYLIRTRDSDTDPDFDGKVIERPLAGPWGSLAQPAPKNQELKPTRPAVSVDGKMFVVSHKGEVFQMWWDGNSSSWQWYNHRQPLKFKLFTQQAVKAVHVGGCTMPGYKVHVTCDDGKLWEIYYNGTSWLWANLGNPAPFKVDSPAEAIRDGSVWVACKNGSNRQLFEKRFFTTQWLWVNHGTPGTNVVGTPATAPNVDKVAVKGADGNFHMRSKSGSVWSWQNLGQP